MTTANVWPYVLLISSRFCGGDNYRRDNGRYPLPMPVTVSALLASCSFYVTSCWAALPESVRRLHKNHYGKLGQQVAAEQAGPTFVHNKTCQSSPPPFGYVNILVLSVNRSAGWIPRRPVQRRDLWFLLRNQFHKIILNSLIDVSLGMTFNDGSQLLRLFVVGDDECVWSIDGIILSGENRRTLRKIRLSASLSTTNPTWTTVGLNLCLDGSRQATNRLWRGKTIIISNAAT
jgi:hypothetical protein